MEAPLPTSAPIDLPSEPPRDERDRQVDRTLAQLKAAVEAAGTR